MLLRYIEFLHTTLLKLADFRSFRNLELAKGLGLFLMLLVDISFLLWYSIVIVDTWRYKSFHHIHIRCLEVMEPKSIFLLFPHNWGELQRLSSPQELLFLYIMPPSLYISWPPHLTGNMQVLYHFIEKSQNILMKHVTCSFRSEKSYTT